MVEFENLFREALAEWPPVLKLRIKRLPRDRHMVVGLTDLADEIQTAHHGSDRESVFGHMHWAIVTAIHATAEHWPRHTLQIRMHQISRDLVRQKFESDLASSGDC
jgi:hypothetical protein